MTELSELNADELQQMAKLQFQMLAETWAALSKVAQDRSSAKLRTSCSGMIVAADLIAQEEG